MRRVALLPAVLICLGNAAPSLNSSPSAAVPAGATPTSIVQAAKPAEWKAIPADDLMVIDLKSGKRVVVQLAPLFAPVHVANIRALAKNGGVVGISYVPNFVDPETWQKRAAAATGPPDGPSPLIPRVVDHIEHAMRVAGPEHIGLGSDFDGGGTALRDATELPLITQSLLERGHSEAIIRGVLGENLLRVFGQAH